ncbi:hypothetical protein ACQ4PT_051335 [Festuca glaucescens]
MVGRPDSARAAERTAWRPACGPCRGPLIVLFEVSPPISRLALFLKHGMDDRTGSVQESTGVSISGDDDCIEQQKKSNVKLEENHGEAQADLLLEDPELGMTFDIENDVREYYKNYGKAKGSGVTKRSSNRDDNGELKYLTLCCSRHGKTESNSRNMLKPNPGLGCKAKVNIVRAPDGKFHISTVIVMDVVSVLNHRFLLSS